MARYYSVEFENITAPAADIDFFELAAADDKPIEIVYGVIGQFTDMGEAEEEGLPMTITRNITASGSGGSVVTPRPLNPNDAAAGFTCEVGNTTTASGGSPEILHAEVIYSRIGWFYLPPAEARPKLSQAENLMIVSLSPWAGDALSLSGTLVVKEY